MRAILHYVATPTGERRSTIRKSRKIAIRTTFSWTIKTRLAVVIVVNTSKIRTTTVFWLLVLRVEVTNEDRSLTRSLKLARFKPAMHHLGSRPAPWTKSAPPMHLINPKILFSHQSRINEWPLLQLSSRRSLTSASSHRHKASQPPWTMKVAPASAETMQKLLTTMT